MTYYVVFFVVSILVQFSCGDNVANMENDGFNLESFLNNSNILNRIMNCILDKGPCFGPMEKLKMDYQRNSSSFTLQNERSTALCTGENNTTSVCARKVSFCKITVHDIEYRVHVDYSNLKTKNPELRLGTTATATATGPSNPEERPRGERHAENYKSNVVKNYIIKGIEYINHRNQVIAAKKQDTDEIDKTVEEILGDQIYGLIALFDCDQDESVLMKNMENELNNLEHEKENAEVQIVTIMPKANVD
ncbi:unnamed protein product [Brassicogethes aeneus]|uniref:Uncharacterized protein n=1 Tax=Brassicogethes aeneus TaxID=1431903 RepID=A0A9P0FFE0_BRAAE|nr:unnamed protein product [Brassicogethes aeneus]